MTKPSIGTLQTLVFDIGHDRGLEIHPVYSVEILTSVPGGDLSGAWTDDDGNTYFVRHDAADNSVWYAGLSPLGSEAFGQVFRGAYDPVANTVSGNIVALSLGYEASAPPLGFSPTFLGDTGEVTFALDVDHVAGRFTPTLSLAQRRLMKLYEARPAAPL